MLIHLANDNDIHPPLFGASQRSFGLARGLARRHDVRVLCVVPNRNRAASEELAANVTLIRRRAWYTSVAWRLERARVSPLFLAAHGHRAARRRLLEALPGRADVIAADLMLASLLDGHAAGLRVHTSHNVEYDHFREAGAEPAFASFWSGRLRALEAHAVAGADLTVACSDEDAARLRELYRVPPESVVVIANGYDETRVRPATDAARAQARAALGLAERDYVTLFLGSDVPHNRAGLDRLTREVFPALAGQGFKLLVVGSVTRALPERGPEWLLQRPAAADIAPFLDAADAGVNPVAAGGGSNVKLPTYLAAGLAAVTTPHGLRGYPSLAPHVTVAAPAHIAQALRERPAGTHARGAALPPAVTEHAWGRLGERLGDILEERLAARRGEHSPPDIRERARA